MIENGVDVEHYRPVALDVSGRLRSGVQAGHICFGTVAGLGSYKRVDIIIEAARILLKTRQDFSILIAGDSSSGKRLVETARSCGVNNLHYCGLLADVRPLIAQIDVGFILSDSVETASYASRETMAMAKPMLSSSYSGLKENVIDGWNGLLVMPGNAAETARAMENFMNMTPDDRYRMGQHSRQLVLERFDVRIQRAQHASLYRAILGRTNSSS